MTDSPLDDLDNLRPPPWMRAPWERFWRARQAGRLPHALLLAGAAGIGKGLFAEALAAALLCPRVTSAGLACGHCEDCQLLRAGNHPDRALLGPDPDAKTQEIRVDAIRELIQGEALSAHRGQYKIILIDPAHQLNRAAANSLLKTLEEPSAQTVMILVSAEPNRLPATIRSRCQCLTMPLPTESMALAWLSERAGDADPRQLLRLAPGAPVKALAYRDSDLVARREERFAGFQGVVRGACDPIAEAGAWNTLDSRLSCQWLSSWVSDLLRLAADRDCVHLTNPDKRADLLRLVERLDAAQLHVVLQRIFYARAVVDTTINKQLLLESILIDLAQLSPETG